MHRPRSSTHQVALSGAVEPGRIAVIGSRRAETEPLIDPMPVLIALEMEARDCTDLAALKFLIVNATRRLAPYDLAVLMDGEPDALHNNLLAWLKTCSANTVCK